MAKEKKTVIEGEVLDSQNHHTRTRNKLSVTSMTVVTKSNELIQKTRYSLPKTQQKLLLAMIAQINPKEDTDPNKVYTMSFSNFSRLTGADTRSSSYRTYLKIPSKNWPTRVSGWMMVQNPVICIAGLAEERISTLRIRQSICDSLRRYSPI